MKFKVLLSVLLILSVFSFLSCNDDVKNVGLAISPNSDQVDVKVDTVSLLAKTVPMDSIYSRTIFGLVGEYHEPLFGSIKSDYLCELYSDNASFKEGNDKNAIKIDSVSFDIIFFNFTGDSISPMDISVYKLNKSLKRYHYTNINPSVFYSPDGIVGQESFSIHNLAKSSTGGRTIRTPLDKKIGDYFLNLWKATPGVFENSDELKKHFPGFYITSRFGNGSLINVDYSIFNIYYSYLGKTKDAKSDSTYHATFSLAVTPEVIQLNHVENKNNELLNNDDPNRAYIKSPAGVCTEITIPLKDILDKKSDLSINSAKFNLIGNTPLEKVSKMPRPSRLLFINKDSVNNFFLKKDSVDYKTCYLLTNTDIVESMQSSYVNRYIVSSSSISVGNLAPLITHYAELKANGINVPDELKYLLIPVDIETVDSENGNFKTYNSMSPSSAILRTDPENMKLSLVFSKYDSK